MKRKFLLVAIGLLTLAVLIALVLLWPAGPEVNDEDLRPARRQIADTDNGFYYLEQAADKFYWPKDKERELNDIADGTSWDSELVQEVLNRNAAVLGLLDRVLAVQVIQVPSTHAPTDSYPYLSSWMHFGLLLSIEAEDRFRRGNQKGAFDLAMRIVQLGDRMEASGEGLVHYSTCAYVKTIGLKRLVAMGRRTNLSPAEIAPYVRQLPDYRANAAGLANAFRFEYQLAARNFEDLRVGTGVYYGGNHSRLERLVWRIAMRLLSNTPKTKAELARAVRACLESISRPYARVTLRNLPPYDPSTFKRVIRGNYAGEAFSEMLVAPWKDALAKKCEENVTVAATQALLALKCYQLKRGKLPTTLAELVPEFLPRVPVDDFDGKPLPER
ncbi:MAG: hypothetical protein ACYDH9_00440 [Limisphaerales bacterium]